MKVWQVAPCASCLKFPLCFFYNLHVLQIVIPNDSFKNPFNNSYSSRIVDMTTKRLLAGYQVALFASRFKFFPLLVGYVNNSYSTRIVLSFSQSFDTLQSCQFVLYTNWQTQITRFDSCFKIWTIRTLHELFHLPCLGYSHSTRILFPFLVIISDYNSYSTRIVIFTSFRKVLHCVWALYALFSNFYPKYTSEIGSARNRYHLVLLSASERFRSSNGFNNRKSTHSLKSNLIVNNSNIINWNAKVVVYSKFS